MSTGYFETNDGAKIYYEDHGKNLPIVLVHGWLCSSRFWQRNVPQLASEYRVVTIDLRGHGNSSKILAGHTIAQYARDLRQVIEHLELHDVVMVGWSMGGPVVLSYYQQFGAESRMTGLGMVDCFPFPFSPGDWNSHALRGYSYDGLHEIFANLTSNHRKFAADFTSRMFKHEPSEADAEWIVAEMMKTPTWIAEAIYSDYVMSDFFRELAFVNIPVIVFAGNAGVFRTGIAMGKALAEQAPHGIFVPFEDAGHILFYEEPQKFNAALSAFAEDCRRTTAVVCGR